MKEISKSIEEREKEKAKGLRKKRETGESAPLIVGSAYHASFGLSGETAQMANPWACFA